MSTTTAAARCRRGHELAGANLYVKPSGKRVCRICRRAAESGHGRRTHPREVLLTVANEPLRERFLDLRAIGEADAQDIAMKLGWTRQKCGRRPGDSPRIVGDGSRLARTLGIIPEAGEYRQRIKYETAVALGALLGLDPHESGV